MYNLESTLLGPIARNQISFISVITIFFLFCNGFQKYNLLLAGSFSLNINHAILLFFFLITTDVVLDESVSGSDSTINFSVNIAQGMYI